MKTTKLLTQILCLITISFVLISCNEEVQHEMPVLEITEPDLSNYTRTTFNAIQSAYEQKISTDTSANYVIFDEDIYITGYVVSSDASGNFFEELIIQNSLDTNDVAVGNPRMGIKLNINTSALYQNYEFGRKVYVLLKGLCTGLDGGLLTLGVANGTEIGQIGREEYKDFVLISTEVSEITPKQIHLTNITASDMNTYVEVVDVQVTKNQMPLTFAGENGEEFDAERILESCSNNKAITLLTSTFSDFKSVSLPTDSGNIKGILTKDYFGEINALKMNSYADIDFKNTRCDLEVLECSGNTSEEFIVFQEDFQAITKEAQLDDLGWTNLNISGGKERYEDSSFGDDVFLKISAFGTGENRVNAWLITPEIDLDNTTEAQLSFEISTNFDTGKTLSVFITNNYTGDPTTAKWNEVDAIIPVGDDGFGVFVKSTINISCLSGTVHVGFKYAGVENISETRYHIDDIRVTGKKSVVVQR